MPHGPHRRASRKRHITWAALERGEIANDACLHLMRQRHAAAGCRIIEYSIGTERHEEPAEAERDMHIHAFFNFDKKLDIPDWRHTRIFDMTGAAVGPSTRRARA